jgi:hypothetical protein
MLAEYHSQLNYAPAPNRRPLFTLAWPAQFICFFCAPLFCSAAVGEAQAAGLIFGVVLPVLTNCIVLSLVGALSGWLTGKRNGTQKQ